MTRIAEIDRFLARSDGGVEYEIIVFQDFIPAGTHDDAKGEIPGLKFMETSGGLHVNFVDAKTFQVVETNEVVRKVG